MTLRIIRHSRVIYSVEISEADVRAALIDEACETHGLLHEGKPVPGCTITVNYDGSRRNGTYIVRIERDLSKSGQAQLPAPAGKDRDRDV